MRGTLLYIDDDKEYGGIMCALLKKRGFEAHYASTLAAAEELLKTQKTPNVVVIDYSLHQEGQSVVFATYLRSCLPDAAMIMVSGRVGKGEDAQRLLSENVLDAYVKKPFNVNELSAAINSCLAKRGPCVRPEISPHGPKRQK